MTARQTTPPHPIVFLVMYLPFGIGSGYFTVTLGYLLSHGGVSTAAIAGLIAIPTWLQVCKLTWAPLVDSVLTYRALYLLAAAALACGLGGLGLITANAHSLPMLTVLAVVMGAAMGLVGVTTNGLMARATPAHQRGRAGGWSQVGNLGGSGLGGGLGLYIATHAQATPWLSTAVMAGLCALCMPVIRFVPEPDHPHRAAHFLATQRNLLREVWRLVISRPGALGLVIMLLPLGTGSAGNLFSAIAGDWGASSDLVALVTGISSGVAAALGCLLGGYVCDAIDRKAGYLLAGMMMAVCTFAMIIVPKTPTSFAVLTLLYAVTGGLAYAACYAVVLEAAGTVAAASKCDLLISVSNTPIAAMTMIDGAAQTRFGSNGMLLTESLCGVGAVIFFMAVAVLSKKRQPALVGTA